ncbi:MAG: metallophosphoesterase [Candidatus Nanoarchaeia archaeon]|nr:metallophosphoesterase [Candidatus Nanoarchaeia archaeon]
MKNINKNKILFIGDIHGNNDWKDIAEEGLKRFYEIVFLGDYVDSFFIKPIDQIKNLKELIHFVKSKTANPDNKITLLLGNHDYAYINGYSGISGYQHSLYIEYQKLFRENIDLFKIAWGHTNEITKKYTLATHAGLTRRFWNAFVLPIFTEGNYLNELVESKKPEDLEIHETLNLLRDKGSLLWKVGSYRGGSGTPGPLWADYDELLEDAYDNINQIFGHTPKTAVTVDHFDDNFYACIDSYGNKFTASLVVSL